MFQIPHAAASILEIDQLAIVVLAILSGQLLDQFARPIKPARNATAEM
jgi:hypothetical protein